jgi:hypothetical protein
MAIVPFTMETVGKCKCPVCPVQSESKCVGGLKNGLSDALLKKPLQKEDVPGAYCATGKATCADLDPQKPCICGTCSIYTEYTLSTGKPGGKFCANGMAM